MEEELLPEVVEEGGRTEQVSGQLMESPTVVKSFENGSEQVTPSRPGPGRTTGKRKLHSTLTGTDPISSAAPTGDKVGMATPTGPAKKRRRSSSVSSMASPTSAYKPALTERQQLALLKQMADPLLKQSPGGASIASTDSSPRDTPNRRIHRRNERGETPLHLACIRGDRSSVVSLIEQGADVNTNDNAGWTPLHEACNHGHVDIVSILLDNDALVNAFGMDKDTPLHDAVINGHLEVVRLLLKRGSDPNIVNSREKKPVDICQNGAIRQLLLEYHANSSPVSTNDKEQEPVEDKEVFIEEIKSPHPLFVAQTPPTRISQLKHGRRAGTPPARLQGHLVRLHSHKSNSRGSFYSDISSSESEVDYQLEATMLSKPCLFDLPSISEVDSDCGDQSNENSLAEKMEEGESLDIVNKEIKEETISEDMKKSTIDDPSSPLGSDSHSNLEEIDKKLINYAAQPAILDSSSVDDAAPPTLLISFPLKGLSLSLVPSNEGPSTSNEQALVTGGPDNIAAGPVEGSMTDSCSITVVTGSVQNVPSIGGESLSDNTKNGISSVDNNEGDNMEEAINEDSSSTVISLSTSLPLVFGSSHPQSPASPPTHTLTTPTLMSAISIESKSSQETTEDDVISGTVTAAAIGEKVKSPPTFENLKEIQLDSKTSESSLPIKRRRSREVYKSKIIKHRREIAAATTTNPITSVAPPHNYNSYLLCTQMYRSHLLPQPTDPQCVYPPISSTFVDLFMEQERDRLKLLSSHLTEVDRLVICFEQELLRAHEKVSRPVLLSNHYSPTSVCSILIERGFPSNQTYCAPSKQEENLVTESLRDERILSSYVQDVWDKFHKESVSLAGRHKSEVESLWLLQVHQWINRHKESGTTHLSITDIPSTHVPVTHCGTFPYYVH